jgi:hypothetical protein
VTHSKGAAVRFVTGRASKRPEASSCSCSCDLPSFDDVRAPAFPSPNPDGAPRRHLSRIECHPSAISPAVEQLSAAQGAVADPQPYFVPSTASASEILTNVAVQDWFATDDAGFYEAPCHHPASTSSLASVSDSWDAFDFVNPFAPRDEDDVSDSGSGSGLGSDSENVDLRVDEGTSSADTSPQSSPPPIQPTAGSSSQLRPSEPETLPSSVHVNKTVHLISSSVVEVTFRNTCSDSPPGEDDDYGEEAIIIPVTSFPHPHCLSPIIEADEGAGSPGPDPEYEEDQDDTSDTETIRPSRVLTLPRLAVDTEFDGPFGDAEQHVLGEYSPGVTDRRMSL